MIQVRGCQTSIKILKANMFTGIVRGMGDVISRRERDRLITFEIDAHNFAGGFFHRSKIGASVSISGVCLSVAERKGTVLTFDVMEESLIKTTLDSLYPGDKINIEPSFKAGDDVGGHILSGHVIDSAEIIEIEIRGDVTVMTFKHDPALTAYIFEKGFIALDGCSLTIVDADDLTSTFKVHLIPETMRRTTFGLKKKGDSVNLEIDSRIQAIVETARRMKVAEDSALDDHYQGLN